MNHKITYRRACLNKNFESDPNFQTLYHIFEATLKPGMRYREFKAYFASSRLEYIDVTFILLNQKIIGFCSAAFYESIINERKYTIGRAATGILEIHRGRTLPKWKLYKKYIQYWLKHPFRHIILSAYVANPLIYAMICKYTGVAFPRFNSAPPASIVNIKDQLLRSQNLHVRENPAFVVEIHFCVDISDLEQQRIFNSTNGDVKYFLKINPRFRQQYGVLVIIPVHFRNIIYSSGRFLYYTVGKYGFKLIQSLQRGSRLWGNFNVLKY